MVKHQKFTRVRPIFKLLVEVLDVPDILGVTNEIIEVTSSNNFLCPKQRTKV